MKFFDPAIFQKCWQSPGLLVLDLASWAQLDQQLGLPYWRWESDCSLFVFKVVSF